MEFIIEKKKLLDCLNHFQSVVEKRNTIPILSNIKITTDSTIQNRLIFTATDLALEISEKLDVKLIKPGGITIPSQLFYELIRKAPDGCNITVSYEESSNNAIVLFNNSKFSFPTMPIDDFPVMDNKDLDKQIDLDIKSMKHLINNCKFCMGLDESRQYLNGIFFHVSNEQISTVATDGHRLAKCVLEKKTDSNFDGIIIPKKSVYEISKVLDEISGNVSLNFSKNRLKVIIGQIVIITKLINSSFPDYESVIPKEEEQIVTVDCKKFSETIDRVATISNEKFRTVKFQIKDNLCIVSSSGSDKSSGTESIEVKYNGPEININFNSRYILDVLSLIKEGQVIFNFSKDTSPTVLTSESFKDALFLIMQMRA